MPYTNNILLDLRNGIECQDNGKGRVISMPGKKDRNDRIRQDVTDISSPDELLRLALAGQLEPRARRDHSPMSFRAWQAITKLVKLSAAASMTMRCGTGSGSSSPTPRTSGEHSLYAGRS